MPQIARSVATLRIYGDDLRPERVTERLGCSPTGSHRKGEVLRTLPDGRQRLGKTGMWRLEAADREPGDLDGQIRELSDRLPDRADVWQALMTEFEGDLFVGLFMEDTNEQIEIAAGSLAILARWGVSLCLDIYDPVDSEEE